MSSQETEDVFRRLPAMAFVHDGDQRLVAASDRWLDRLGLARGAALGRPLGEFLSPDSRTRYADALSVACGAVETLRVSFRDGAGRAVPASLSVSLSTDRDGRLVEARAVATEVDDGAAFVEALLEAVPSPVFFKDRAGVYLGCNGAFAEMLGRPREQIVGRTVFDLAPEDLAGVYQAADEALFRDGGRQVYEAQVKAGDGTVRDVVFHKTLFGTAERPATGLIGVVFDITERRGAEARLRESKRDIDAILGGANETILVMDPDGTIRLINEVGAHRFGGTPAEIVGENLFDLLPAPLARIRRAKIAEILSSRKPAVHLDRRDGRYYESSISPVTGDEGRVVRLVVLARDITERVQMDEREKRHRMELSHLSRVATMGEMATQLAHELNQPLSAIHNYARGIARRLETGGGKPEEIAGAVNEIAEEARLGSEIIKRIRAHVRKAEPVLAPTDLSAVARMAVTLARVEAETLDIELVTGLADGLARPWADAVEIEQVMLNLLRNAVDAVAEQDAGARRVTIRTEPAGIYEVRVTVTDTGAGLPREVENSAFEPFVSTKADGLGMGLSISRTIIEAHGGRLWISEPEPDKQGEQDGETVFRFTLPVTGAGP